MDTAHEVICFTVVHYRNTAEVHRFLAHLAAQPLPSAWGLSVAVADQDGTWTAPAGTAAPHRVCTPGRNLGYLGGCRYARAQWVAAEGRVPAWTVLCNTDIRLEPRFLEKLLGYAWPEAVGVVAPDVRRADGLVQNPFLRTRPSRMRMYGYQLIYRSALLTGIHHGLHRARRYLREWRARPAGPHPDLVPIYAPHGSAVLLRDRFFHRGGDLASRLFMHLEEIHLAEQARRAGVQVVWAPWLHLAHEGAAATGRVGRRRVRRWRRESARIVWEDYFRDDEAGGCAS